MKFYLFLISFPLVLFNGAASGETRSVPSPTYPTIQSAIDAASENDIVLVADGTYTGEGSKNLDFCGKAITVRSENGPEKCIIDCEGVGRGFYFHSSETQSSVLDGFTITNGLADYGGGIRCSATPTINNCKILNNEAERSGGGVYFSMWSANIKNCIIAGNKATWGGAMYFSYAQAQVTNCTTFGNTGLGAIGISEYSPAFTNCILWDEPSQFYVSYTFVPPSIVLDYCDMKSTEVVGPTIIHSDPLFVDLSSTSPINWNFHLQSGSPCIDAGTSENAPNTDIDGDSRPQGKGYDIGADEYCSHFPWELFYPAFSIKKEEGI